MQRIKKIICAVSALAITMGVSVSASAAFSDMPSGEMGSALQSAVDAGLMDGVSDDSIAPNDNITRAQMATIMVRAFGAQDLGTDKSFNDIKGDEWYADYVKKAATMGAFEGDDDNNFNPEANITFQETYAVLSRLFGFEAYQGKSGMISDCDMSVLDKFSDKDSIADWAKNYAKYITGNGGWTGIDGKLKPEDAVTRGEFAMIMDKIVYTYVDSQEAADALKGKTPDGAVLVRKGGLTVNGLETNKNLIITFGIKEDGLQVTDSTVNGVTVVYGGADKTPVANQNGKILPDESYVTITGSYNDVRVSTPYVYLNASDADMDYYKGIEGSLVSLMLRPAGDTDNKGDK